MDEKEIFKILLEVIKNSYSPYSRFRVASAVMCKDGRIYTGVNVENSSYGLSICAERVAVFKAVSEGCRAISRVYVISDHSKPIPPCGACLQVISEFSPEGDTEIIMLSPTGEAARKRLTEMLTTLFKGEILQDRITVKK
ncbi:cytidine deaminase [Desulfurococcaceae archaeon AG1]|jgi:cytidine deaminase|nr:MAG: cytidine deaminase [Desulfurococcaceae archaeon]GAY26535.1 cytidine deaminase [Desulfurococcaceae archaeon AG1]